MRSTSSRVERELNLVLVFLELLVSRIDQPQRLFRFQPRRIVLLGHEQRKEHRVEAALFRAHQIELPVVDPLAHVAAVVELPIDDVDVRVEDERIAVNSRGAIGNRRLCNDDPNSQRPS